ncbi:MAG: nucleotidyltransferase domain-containing protein [Melioribacteraceae bacterium]|nr:nucleotidyltransferase domain-containing protein [Melioribacteraceae bacterium]
MNKYLELVKEIALKNLSNINVEVFLFGSRATSSELDKSDIDIGILGNKKVSSIIISKLYAELEESVVPYHVDIVDFFNVDKEFRRLATQNKIVWKKKKNIN